MTVRKCDLCKEAAFVPLPGSSPGASPVGWIWVHVGTEHAHQLLICPFCIAVARALQAADVEHTKAQLVAANPAEADNKALPPHPFKNPGIRVLRCARCGLPDTDSIHSDKSIYEFQRANSL